METHLTSCTANVRGLIHSPLESLTSGFHREKRQHTKRMTMAATTTGGDIEAFANTRVTRLTGEEISISSLWDEGPAVLVFLRHFG